MKYYIWILGCAMNYSDAERLGAVLSAQGYKRTFDEKESDLFIVVSCSVRQSAINRIYGKAKDLQKLKTKNTKFKTILTGCVLEKDKKKMAKIFDVMLEIKDLADLPEMLSAKYSSSEQGESRSTGVKFSTSSKNKVLSGEYLKITPDYESSFRAYVPIMTGCNNFCSYCAVPYTRGREKSRPMEEIVAEVKSLVEKGYKEITLLGQNVNSYGLYSSSEQDESKSTEISRQSSNNKFIALLKEIDKIRGDYRVYFYSNHPKDMSDELIELMPKLKHFPKYIHLPLQSGSSEVIKRMNRHYTKESYLALVQKIRKAMPGVALATDVMVGFPEETPEQFAETVEVMQKAQFDMAFTAQYSPREGTTSAKWNDNVSKEEKIAREKKLIEVLEKTAAENNKKLEGTIQKVLIDGEKGSKLYGRTEGYKVVEITNSTKQITRKTKKEKQKTPTLIGEFCEVKVLKTGPWKLIGELFS